jgi:hypothetical protein
VLDATYVIADGEVEEAATPLHLPASIVRFSAELVREAYRLLQSNVRGSFVGVHQCLPYGWYIWEEEFENDIQRRLVLVYENQRAGYEALDAEFSDPARIPIEISEDYARDLVRQFFADSPDPLPRWADLQSILQGRRKGCNVVFYTFEDKKAFDPALLAKRFHDDDLGEKKQIAELQALWDQNDACRLIYRTDFQSFVEDVKRELTALSSDATAKALPVPKFIQSMPTARPKPWPNGERGYSLTELKDAVLAQPRHFPDGAPLFKELRYASKSAESYFGFFRYADKALVIDPKLNSPDVPRYVMEFLLYHELLHADMPSAGHNRDFRVREMRFNPSEEALADAQRREHVPGPSRDAWRVLADQFLCTFTQYFASGKRMEL